MLRSTIHPLAWLRSGSLGTVRVPDWKERTHTLAEARINDGRIRPATVMVRAPRNGSITVAIAASPAANDGADLVLFTTERELASFTEVVKRKVTIRLQPSDGSEKPQTLRSTVRITSRLSVPAGAQHSHIWGHLINPDHPVIHRLAAPFASNGPTPKALFANAPELLLLAVLHHLQSLLALPRYGGDGLAPSAAEMIAERTASPADAARLAAAVLEHLGERAHLITSAGGNAAVGISSKPDDIPLWAPARSAIAGAPVPTRSVLGPASTALGGLDLNGDSARHIDLRELRERDIRPWDPPSTSGRSNRPYLALIPFWPETNAERAPRLEGMHPPDGEPPSADDHEAGPIRDGPSSAEVGAPPAGPQEDDVRHHEPPRADP